MVAEQARRTGVPAKTVLKDGLEGSRLKIRLNVIRKELLQITVRDERFLASCGGGDGVAGL